MLRSHLPTGPAAESVAGLVESWPESGCRRAEQVLINLKVTSTGPGLPAGLAVLSGRTVLMP